MLTEVVLEEPVIYSAYTRVTGLNLRSEIVELQTSCRRNKVDRVFRCWCGRLRRIGESPMSGHTSLMR